MKRTGICPKCNSNRIGYLENVTQRTEANVGPDAVRGHCPAPLGIERSESQGFIKVIKEGPVGKLEAYFCTTCGYFETYVKDVASIPFEKIIGFKWVNPQA